jgi:hypothetical protein
MLTAAAELVAALITTTLLGFAAAIAVAGVQFLLHWRLPTRTAALASVLQYMGTVLALLGLVYRDQNVGAAGLLLVILSILIGDIRRESSMPRLEVGLTVLAMANLVSVTAVLAF